MSFDPDGETDFSTAQTNPSVNVMSEVSMPLDFSTDSGVADASAIIQSDQPFRFAHALLHDGGINLEFEDWLTSENYGDAMHHWPFVIDGNDGPPYSGAATHTRTKPLTDLRRSWYTHLEDEGQVQSGDATPVPGRDEIDDEYRQSLDRRLQIRSIDQSLPSVEYMNLCVKSYFRKFHPVFPLVHAATFRPLKTNSVLLLSICSIGSLLTGHPSAYARGVQLFERLHKAILAHWEKLVGRGPEDALAVAQASLIGQTFGLLSGKAKHLAIVDAFHGTVISLARRCKVFHAQSSPVSDQNDLDHNWKAWILNEEKIRVALGLRIHDAEIASMLHHETYLPSATRVSQVVNDVLFAAPSAQDWFMLQTQHKTNFVTPVQRNITFSQRLGHKLIAIPQGSYFVIYSALEDVCAEIIEARMNGSLTTAVTQGLQECLILLYEQHLHDSQYDPLRNGCKILWHYLFIQLFSDLDLLERSIGREGPDPAATDISEIQAWVSSVSAHRCVAHAIMIKRNLECIPLSFEPAIHVPRCVFASIICLFCYTRYGSNITNFPGHFSEFRLFDNNVASLLREVKGGASNDVEMETLYGFADLLKRIGHWEVSRTFSSIIEVLLQADSR